MIIKHILLITFLNEPELFTVLLYNSQNSTSVICLHT